MARLKDYLTTRTHEDYLWPHPIPLSEKPSQPPVRPGIRLYGPEPDDRICKENTNLDDYKHWSKRVEKAKDGDDEVLSDREKFMFLNKIDKKKKVNHELESLKSTYQVSYAAIAEDLITMQLIEKIFSFLRYWYFRYTLVTELYMVENWERHFVNIFLITLFCLLFYFNYKVLLPVTSSFIES